MRVLHATAWYPPEHLGGTEVYVSGLVRELRGFGVDSRVITPNHAEKDREYEFDGTPVRGYRVNDEPSREELRGEAPHTNFTSFRRLLEEERPDIYHQHSWTRELGGVHLHAAREAGLKTVLTVHVPNAICMRGTMMLFGKQACDGRIDASRCAACWSEVRGAPKLLAHALAAVPSGISGRVGRLPFGGRAATALSAHAQGERKREEFLRMADDADRIVAVCQWLYDALLINGVPKEKLVLSRQGVAPDFALPAAQAAMSANPPTRGFRLLCLGRWHPVKGMDVLVRAVRKIPRSLPLSLVIHATGDGAEERAYADAVHLLAQDDSRISIQPPLARDQLPEALAMADALAVPSLCLETGPLVVLEAKAVGLPVIGSRLGGIAELVAEPEDGILVAPGDIAAWAEALRGFIAKTRRPSQHRVVPDVRTMREAAENMAALYRSLAGVVLQTERSCTV